jgi:2-dehydro-3-deoxygluconokinase
VGRLIQDFIYQGGVDQTHVKWVEYDGVGRSVRNGLNFTERGYGVRAAAGCSDRGHTAASQMKPGDIDWDEIFGKSGARWFHTGGIFCGLSPTTPEVAIEAMQAAKRHGVVTSYDLNYRPSLWKANGGQAKATEVNCRIAELVDVMVGGAGDFSQALGFDVADVEQDETGFDTAPFRKTIEQVVKEFPFKVVASTLRKSRSASRNDWSAICWADGQFYEASHRPAIEILDRVGGGDSFDSGLFYGFLTGQSPQWAVECGAAHGALAMTTPGDTTMATLSEVLNVMKGGEARVMR